MINNKRDIALITDELRAAVITRRGNTIDIGALLIEAKEALDHGAWLPWLAANFGSSESTANNYMNAARLAAKYPTVGDLKLKPKALYLLGGNLDDDGLYTPKAIEAILAAAKDEWVDVDRAYDIAWSMQPPDPEEEDEDENRAWKDREEEARRALEEKRRAEEKEAEDILDGPPPDLPPAPEPATPDVVIPQFDKAIDMLAQVYTKPLASFTATTHTPDKIEGIIAFLQALVPNSTYLTTLQALKTENAELKAEIAALKAKPVLLPDGNSTLVWHERPSEGGFPAYFDQDPDGAALSCYQLWPQKTKNGKLSRYEIHLNGKKIATEKTADDAKEFVVEHRNARPAG